MIPSFMGKIMTSWRAEPVVTLLEPTSMLPAGGALTIHGHGFRAGVSVTVGGIAATAVVVVTTKLLTCIAPALSVGFYPVVVGGVTGPDLEYSVL